MVVDHRGRIAFATTQLASMLGWPQKTLTTMEVASIIPQPYSQLHAGFMKVRPAASWVLHVYVHYAACFAGR